MVAHFIGKGEFMLVSFLMLTIFLTNCSTNVKNLEPPNVSPALVWFDDEQFHLTDPKDMILMWDPYNLTMNTEAKVTISLWGYKVNKVCYFTLEYPSFTTMHFRKTILNPN